MKKKLIKERKRKEIKQPRAGCKKTENVRNKNEKKSHDTTTQSGPLIEEKKKRNSKDVTFNLKVKPPEV